jgi:hypothetical protein
LNEDSFQPDVETGDDKDFTYSDSDDFVPPTSIEDEDTSGDHDVSQVDVLAEVKLPSNTRWYSFHCFL